MLRYGISLFADRTVHPVLAFLLVAGTACLAVGLITEATGQGLVSGFLGVYASLFLFLGGAGYAAVVASKLTGKLRHQYDRTT